MSVDRLHAVSYVSCSVPAYTTTPMLITGRAYTALADATMRVGPGIRLTSAPAVTGVTEVWRHYECGDLPGLS